jgi:hypothetical protein
MLAKQARSVIENGTPDLGLDRLHTFVLKYIASLGRSMSVILADPLIEPRQRTASLASSQTPFVRRVLFSPR